jgi:hypothetical protein
MALKRAKTIILITFSLMLTHLVLSQTNSLRGTVKIRKSVSDDLQININKRVFTSRENPLKGKWILEEYKVN